MDLARSIRDQLVPQAVSERRAEAAGTDADKTAFQRALSAAQSLRVKLILPYLILTLVTAMVGTFVVTRLVTSSLRERFANQLLEASRVAADGVVARETEHLEQLRLMAFTEGVDAALAANDRDRLQELLYPLVLNGELDSLTVVNRLGNEVLTLVEDPETGDYQFSGGSDLSDLDLAILPILGEQDELGDKFAGVLNTAYGPYLMTSAPVTTEQDEIVGALLLGSSLDSLLPELKAQVLADIVVLDQRGELAATTLAPPEDGYGRLELSQFEANDLDPARTREVSLYRRDYQVYYSPLVVRGSNQGVLGVVLPSSFIISTESTSRNLFSAIFTAGTMSIIIVGYLLARSISNPLVRLRDVSLAVAAGDLDQRTGLKGEDEVGQLAAVFDLMTFRLRRRTKQAERLYEESIERNEQLAQANARLQEAQQQLVQSEKLAAVGQLTAGIVHDVKNPLAVVRGLAEEAQIDFAGNEPLQEHLTMIRDNATRANNIVSDLLKFARQSDPEMRHQDLCETVRTSLRLTDYLIRKGKVTLTTEYETENMYVSYDAQQIEQVLVNLIQNAIQAMPDGGSLAVEVQEVGDWAQITVRDDGEGIPAQNLKRIFDPFFTTKPAGEGTGLGLSVSYGIMRQHGGSIEVESEAGVGTTFTLRLPRKGEPAKAKTA